MPPPPAAAPRRVVGVESLALDAARMMSLAFLISARERELSFQSCGGGHTERGGGRVRRRLRIPP